MFTVCSRIVLLLGTTLFMTMGALFRFVLCTWLTMLWISGRRSFDRTDRLMIRVRRLWVVVMTLLGARWTLLQATLTL